MEQEVWKKVSCYPSYEVSNQGRVRSLPRIQRYRRYGRSWNVKTKETLLVPILTSTGYFQVNLYRNKKSKPFFIHRLVATAFIGNENKKPQINHKDGIKTNNNVLNLEWVTASENGIHSYRVLGNVAWQKGNLGKETPTAKPVIQKTIDGHVVMRWDCASDAIRAHGFNSSGITRCCQGIYKHHGGYVWEYA